MYEIIHTSISSSTKYVVIVVFIQTFPARDFRRLSNKSSIIKSHVQKADFQSVVADQVDQFVGLGRDRLLVEKHEKTVQPLRCDAMRLGAEGQERDLPLGCLTAGAIVSWGFEGSGRWR
jgi:hypothetical protein